MKAENLVKFSPQLISGKSSNSLKNVNTITGWPKNVMFVCSTKAKVGVKGCQVCIEDPVDKTTTTKQTLLSQRRLAVNC